MSLEPHARDLDADQRPLGCMVDRVVEEVREHAPDQIRIRTQLGYGDARVDPHARRGHTQVRLLEHGPNQRVRFDRAHDRSEPVLVGLADVEQVRDHPRQRARLVLDLGCGAARALHVLGLAQHRLGMELDRVDRVLEIVDQERDQLLFLELKPLEMVALLL